MIAMDGFHQFHCPLGPDGPLPQESADKTQLLLADAEFRHQIGNDIVIVAGVQGYFADPAALGRSGYPGTTRGWGELSGTAAAVGDGCCRASGPRRNSETATSAPKLKMPTPHQKAVV